MSEPRSRALQAGDTLVGPAPGSGAPLNASSRTLLPLPHPMQGVKCSRALGGGGVFEAMAGLAVGKRLPLPVHVALLGHDPFELWVQLREPLLDGLESEGLGRGEPLVRLRRDALHDKRAQLPWLAEPDALQDPVWRGGHSSLASAAALRGAARGAHPTPLALLGHAAAAASASGWPRGLGGTALPPHPGHGGG
eukprot:CAMPEP_0168434836 /NCGR_PEP_ID=MMETSP0228-20121227/40109_1 /TAXON_ID=133427 /ORGANISM="Protoceratium reticulatum, Strain CCCM 535 (=CCMP 1889)" /LENGTH=193 /DNA_ID=CAMNT_0008449001 /DNA_START=104 /DNA_END=683 /DNA_ORIENTATION=+